MTCNSLEGEMRYGLSNFFMTDSSSTEIYSLSLHDALPILKSLGSELESTLLFSGLDSSVAGEAEDDYANRGCAVISNRSEEHTSELQSLAYLVCRLLLESTTPWMFASSDWR